ncbi:MULTISPECIES: polyprenyl synthetase family protein [Brevibacterium]|uniref:Polyprenyl synthetase family protein n=1 Tax=Brevibacterium spongiae TaxID=2909672 RepID=A0ABY5SN47_9MICO|nr:MULTISPECIES: polyprenyl synthetase family protein [Brevibacterium]UVI35321.1 polyprenyl synthetase family protein [Brevibacterium spongiae]
MESVLTVESRLVEVLAAARRRSRVRTQQYEQLWEALSRMALGGKMIRPRLLIDAHEGLGGTATQAATDAAGAMQLLHIGLIIHDDVIDNDTVRRGEMNITGQFSSEAMLLGATSAAAQTWGISSSLLAGDLMLNEAQSLLARLDLEAPRRLAILDIYDETIAESVAGEQSDVWLSLHLDEADSGDVLTMIGRKTAAYSFEAPLSIAAVLAGSDDSLVERLRAIGRRIGIVYQLRDDVLGLFGDEHETGKSVLSDLREGKETLLINTARTHSAWSQVAHLFGDRGLDAEGGLRLRQAIEESGARAYVESMIAEHCKTIAGLIAEAELPQALAGRLADLTSACSLRCA